MSDGKDKFAEVFTALEDSEGKKTNAWLPPIGEIAKVESEPEVDEFAKDIRDTAKTLMGAIKKTATSAYDLEAKDLASLTKSICDLQNAFYGKDDKAGNLIIQNNQLSMFKDMLK